MGRPHKFRVGDAIVGRDEGPASFRCREGVVKEIGPGRGEYGIQFDAGAYEYVNSTWTERRVLPSAQSTE